MYLPECNSEKTTVFAIKHLVTDISKKFQNCLKNSFRYTLLLVKMHADFLMNDMFINHSSNVYSKANFEFKMFKS